MLLKCESINIYLKEKHFVRNFNHDFMPNKNYWITGELGSGKTLLFKTISGISEPTSGDIKYNGRSLVNCSLEGKINAMRSFGILMEKPLALSNLSLFHNLELVAKVKKTPIDNYIEKLKTVNLEHKIHDRMTDLNFYEQQLFSVICAITHNPTILIWDNCPLDHEGYLLETILVWLKELKARGSCFIFLGEHKPRILENWLTIELENNVIRIAQEEKNGAEAA